MTDFVDPYFDSTIGDLRNLLGATSPVELRALEPQAVFANELELPDIGITRSNDLIELCAIHAQLFKGVYDWAGHVRTVDIKKNRDDAGFFLPVGYIERASGFLFSELADENGLKGFAKDKFVERLAYYYDQLNYIHPFREGNGRSQRVFWTRVAADAGYLIDWDKVVGDENDRASRAAMEDDDRTVLVAMLGRIVRPV
ncbi:MAG: Fic family protein [Micrococcales bacterium]|nr:Fic family protein [Micrococcales bacterium]